MRCVIVDDESGALEILTQYINRTPQLELDASFRDSLEALSYLARHDVDLVFLDIDMPNLDGMQLAELVRNKDMQVIFCTAYSEYAVESYEKEAVDYLLKPIAYERFLKAVDKALKLSKKISPKHHSGIPSAPEHLFIKSGSRIHQLNVNELLYLEKQGHYIVFHTPIEQLLSRMNMADLLRALPADDFIRIHRSYVIALDKIDTIEKHTVVIRNKRIPIGDSFRVEFFKRIKYSGN
jgi:DNA-binding LytR/AlgR family response regulator